MRRDHGRRREEERIQGGRSSTWHKTSIGRYDAATALPHLLTMPQRLPVYPASDCPGKAGGETHPQKEPFIKNNNILVQKRKIMSISPPAKDRELGTRLVTSSQ